MDKELTPVLWKLERIRKIVKLSSAYDNPSDTIESIEMILDDQWLD